jgi:hypothetical protein
MGIGAGFAGRASGLGQSPSPKTERGSPKAEVRSPILPAVRMAVAPVPVDSPLLAVQLNEGMRLVVLVLVSHIRSVFIAIPGVIVLVAFVVVALVVIVPFFLVVVLGAGGHYQRYGKDGS